MDEKLFKKIKSIGAGNIVCGIIAIVAGVATGVVLIINGARLLAHRSNHIHGAKFVDKVILFTERVWSCMAGKRNYE